MKKNLPKPFQQIKHKMGIKMLISTLFMIGFICHASFSQSCGPNKVLICHNGQTLCISDNAVQAHLNHGDYLGTCIAQNCTVTGIGGSITCVKPNVTLSATSVAPGATFSWTGPGNFTSNSPNPIVSTPGVYTVTASASGCTSTDTAVVKTNNTPPTVTASAGTITCINLAATLTSSSTTAGATFKWTGPGNFSSTLQNPTTSVAGAYTITVTNPVNGCTASTTVNVLQNKTLPGATASKSGDLACNGGAVTLTGTSPTAGTTFKWTGPGGFSANGATASVTVAGTYTLTVTDPVNGCTSTASVTVSQNNTAPGASAIKSGDLSCTATSVTLTGTSPTAGATFKWTGPGGFSVNGATATATAAGTYTLTATNPANGCTSTALITVNQSNTPPGASAAKSGDLACTTTSVTLTGTSTTAGATFSWTGPGGFSANGATANATAAGTYTLTATNPANGCTSTALITVNQSNTPPGASAAKSGDLTCTTTSVNLTGTSTTAGATFSWTGPGGFSANGATANATAAGTYTLTATNPANGCTSTALITVNQSNTPPGASASKSGDLTCTTTSVTLTGTSTTAGATFSWTGPGGFSVNGATATATAAGTYTLTATNPANGCTSTALITVNQSNTPPGASASKSGDLTCTTTSVTLTGTSPTAGATFSWTGPGGFSVNGATATATAPGTYTLTATNPANGCTSTAFITVNQSNTPPGASASKSGDLTCTTTSVTLTGTSTTAGATFSWTGPGGFSVNGATATATAPGSYTVFATNPVNGCVSSDTVVVNQNIVAPGASASVSGALNCTTTTVNLSGTSPSPVASFNWISQGVIISTQPNTITSTAGTYILKVTNPLTGCVSFDTIVVQQNTTAPQATATVSGALTCANDSVTLSGTSITSGVSFKWTGPGGFTSQSASAVTTVPGNYFLAVTDTTNGCVTNQAVAVQQDTIRPTVFASASGVLNCNTDSVVLSCTSPSDSLTFLWTGPGTFQSTLPTPSVSVPGRYFLTVSSLANGCTGSASVDVEQDTIPPSVIATGGNITPANPLVTLTATSSTPGVTFRWTGPNDFSSNLQNPQVGVAGTYVVEATNPLNGCSSFNIALVSQTIVLPGVEATGGTITCTNPLVTITANSSTTGVTFAWTGPGGFTSTLPNPSVGVAGIYEVKATNTTTGYFSTDTALVKLNQALPGVTATGGTITCVNATVNLSATSPTAGVSYKWQGPNGFTSTLANPSPVSVTGTYNVTVTNSSNGCKSTSNVIVDENKVIPACSISPSTTSYVAGALKKLEVPTPAPNTSFAWSIASTNTNWKIVGNNTSSSVNIRIGSAGTKATITVLVTNNLTGCCQSCIITLTATTSLARLEQNSAEESGETFVLKHANPLSENSPMVLKTFIDSKAKIDLYSSVGTEVSNLFNGKTLANEEYSMFIKDKNLSNGLYILRLTINNKVYKRRIILNK